MNVQKLAPFLALTLICFAQDKIKPAASDFVLRVQTLKQQGRGLEEGCVLVKRNGDLRMERRPYHSREYNVFESQLSPSAMAELMQLLEDPGIRSIHNERRQGQTFTPDDSIMVRIFRADGSQAFDLLDSKSREPYEKQLTPFLNWLKGLSKQKGAKLDSARANNCSAEDASPLIDSASQPSRPLVQLFTIRWRQAGWERKCVAIYQDMRFHFENTAPGKAAAAKVYEGSLGPEQFHPLEALLNDPNVLNSATSLIQSGVVSPDFQILKVVIRRGESLQFLQFDDEVERKRHKNVAKRFEDWLRSFERNKHPESVGAVANSCQ